MSRKRVVVTGMGMVSPLANSVEATWQRIIAGESGVAPIETFDVSAYTTQFGAGVKDFSIEGYLEPKDARKMDLFIQYGMVAGIQAMQDSGLEVNSENAHRIGAAIGSGIGGISSIEKNHGIVEKSGPRKISPFFVPGSISNMIAGNLSIRFGFTGANLAIVTACTTGTHNIGIGARLIQWGEADVMLVGGSEMATSPVGLGGFAAARALSTRNEDPQAASRPWDRDRDGFVLGDGAGVMLIEEYEHAKRRGAKIYAEVIGFGMSGDAHHMTSPPPNGAGAAASMRNALTDAGVNPDEVGYINAHGTSTPAGDLAECQAVKSVLGSAAERVAVSSTKSMIGHLLGAAGSVEAIFSCLALRDSILPPTINLENPDEDCDLDFVPNTARDCSIEVSVSNSFGFGGTNGSLVFRKAP
ncbi:MAG: beta-ketoacyl-ACP synthase II [Pseudomonadales bacterium]